MNDNIKMDKEMIKNFFNKLAPSWDEGEPAPNDVIECILDNAGVEKGKDILDVACGTGVLFPYYLKRTVNSVTAIDISHEMLKVAGQKYEYDNINLIEDDAETFRFPAKYDCIIIYNAFPHFTDYGQLIYNLKSFLKPDGTLTIAHGMSRKKLEIHHCNVSPDISGKLPDDPELKQLLEPYFNIICFESDETKIQIVGKIKNYSDEIIVKERNE